MDHADPNGATFTIELVRRPARGSNPRGSIMVNPGGPGVSGVDFVRQGFAFDDATSANYHTVGFEPRGSGTDLADCTSLLRSPPLPDASPDSHEEGLILDRHSELVAAECARLNTPLLPHLTSWAGAADLEVLRQALGEPQLNFYGASYGSRLGLHYVSRYPQTTGLMVLDGIVNPDHGLTELLLQQSVAFDHQFSTMQSHCDHTITCPDRGLVATFRAVRERLETTDGAHDFGTQELDWAVVRALYDQSLWSVFSGELSAAYETDDYSGLQALASWLVESPAFTAYLATICVDLAYPDDLTHPNGTDRWDAFVADVTTQAPLLGPTIANEARPCAHWAASPPPTPDLVPPATLTNQLIIMTAQHDPATPAVNASAVASRWPNTVLITADVHQHTAYAGQPCVQEIVQQYFAAGSLPQTAYRC